MAVPGEGLFQRPKGSAAAKAPPAVIKLPVTRIAISFGERLRGADRGGARRGAARILERAV
jgi:hypothetical protein